MPAIAALIAHGASALVLVAVVATLSGVAPSRAADDENNGVLSIDPELERPKQLIIDMPVMDARRGRVLFATKGCVICHEVNGVGGQRDNKAPALDARRMPINPDPFKFLARMWLGAESMINLQKEELGYKLDIRADELADIFAFVHDAEEQSLFTLPGRMPQ